MVAKMCTLCKRALQISAGFKFCNRNFGRRVHSYVQRFGRRDGSLASTPGRRRLCLPVSASFTRGAFQISAGFNFCSRNFGRRMCAYVQFGWHKSQLFGKYAQAATPVLASECQLCKRAFTYTSLTQFFSKGQDSVENASACTYNHAKNKIF